MEVNRLLSDELSYELAIRDLPTTGTVPEKRSILSGVLRCEKLGIRQAPSSVNIEPAEELDVCHRKLTELEQNIESFVRENKDNEYKRISSRLTHIVYRLQRIPTESELQPLQLELQSRTFQAVDRLQAVYETPATEQHIVDQPNRISNNSLLDEDIALIPELVHTEPGTNEEQLHSHVNTSPVGHTQRFPDHLPENRRPPIVQPQMHLNAPQTFEERLRGLQLSSTRNPIAHDPQPFPRYVDVSKWNVRFDGQGSVTNFIERIEEIRISRGITKEQTLRAAPELLSHNALMWYRTNTFASWDDLLRQLKDAFQPYDYDNSLWDELRRRTQGAQEKVVVYVAAMECLFRKLSTPAEEHVRLSLISRNLLPAIQIQLSLLQVKSVRELTAAARAIEETAARADRFCPPPTNYRQLLEPELAYHKPSQSSALMSIDSDLSTHCQAVQDNRTSRVVCWNCDQAGHTFRACSRPRRKFCFRCGRQNETTQSCPTCSGNAGRSQQ